MVSLVESAQCLSQFPLCSRQLSRLYPNDDRAQETVAASVGLAVEQEELQTYAMLWDLRPYLTTLNEAAALTTLNEAAATVD